MTSRIRHLVAAAATLLLAQSAIGGTITGSAHDFKAQAWTGGQICIVCHAPHNNLNSAGTLLWNRADSAAAFTMYTSPTMQSAAAMTVGGVSKLCMSCHDGTIAVDSFGGSNTGTYYAAPDKLVGPNLSNDHPIGMTYDAALVTSDGALQAVTTAVTIGSGGQTKAGTIASNMLAGGKVECSSCHDVHNTYTAGGALLKVSNSGSGLCLTCHIK